MKQTTLKQLSEEEFSPAQLLTESNDEIIKLLNEPRPYKVIGEVWPIDIDEFFGIDPGLSNYKKLDL